MASTSYVRTVTVARPWLAIDANVYVAQFTEEVFSPQAESVFRSGALLIAPDLIGVEVASAFLNKIKRGLMTVGSATAALDGLPRRVQIVEGSTLWRTALHFAREHGLTVYDALYASLALRERCQLVTADTQIADVLRIQSPSSLAWLGDFVAS